jgi:enoyl-CoA hydratase/carnithine racemase
MAVRIEKKGKVWTVIHSRPEARNAMDPASANALVDAFVAFDRDRDAAVAVLWGEGRRVLRRLGPEVQRFAGRRRKPARRDRLPARRAGARERPVAARARSARRDSSSTSR